MTWLCLFLPSKRARTALSSSTECRPISDLNSTRSITRNRMHRKVFLIWHIHYNILFEPWWNSFVRREYILFVKQFTLSKNVKRLERMLKELKTRKQKWNKKLPVFDASCFTKSTTECLRVLYLHYTVFWPRHACFGAYYSISSHQAIQFQRVKRRQYAPLSKWCSIPSERWIADSLVHCLFGGLGCGYCAASRKLEQHTLTWNFFST
jgi:hypothetical protein